MTRSPSICQICGNGEAMSSSDYSLEVLFEMRMAERSLRWLGRFGKAQMTFGQRLRIAELMRDAADEIDRGGQIEHCYVRETPTSLR